MALVRMNRTLPVRSYPTDVFDEFDRMFNELAAPFFGETRGFGESRSFTYPADLYETDDAIVLEMAVPGLTADQLDISIEGRQLTIRAKYPEFEEVRDRRYWLQTIPRGELTRTVRLPASVDIDAIDAKVHDGMLLLTMPKVPEAKVKKIAVTNS